LPPTTSDAAWRPTCGTTDSPPPHCRGIPAPGRDAPVDELNASLRVAAGYDMVKGFAIGRTIFAGVARAWLAGTMTDDEATTRMADNFARLCEVWDKARAR
ncbi:MAG: DUF2090 domain-containing protein, partial [Rhodospirillaceae bacterium]|nr:DUF2090 domain-containing protein [Rhodospirillaceae bacterium]